MTTPNSDPERDIWILDSGASRHMTSRIDWMENSRNCNFTDVNCANGETMYGLAKGKVSSPELGFDVSNALYIPNLVNNLLSVSVLTKNGKTVIFTKEGCVIYSKCVVRGKCEAKGYEDEGLYKLYPNLSIPTTDDMIIDMQLWHRRMGHLGLRNLKVLRDKMSRGVRFASNYQIQECNSCGMGKARPYFKNRRGTDRAKTILEVVYTSVYNPQNFGKSFSGYKYFITFTDDYTRKIFVYFLERKTEVVETIKQFKLYSEAITGHHLQVIRTTNDRAYHNREMDDFIQDEGVIHEVTRRDGVGERINYALYEKAMSMLNDACLSNTYWTEAVTTAVYLKNRSPTQALRLNTPENLWRGRIMDLSRIRVFGCRAYMRGPYEERNQFNNPTELLHMGYEETSNCYRLINPVTKVIYTARDVIFFEHDIFSGARRRKICM